MRFLEVLAAALAILMAVETRVHAYTDPGTGTLIWQILLAASFGLMFYLRRILMWARGLLSRGNQPAAETPVPTVDQNE